MNNLSTYPQVRANTSITPQNRDEPEGIENRIDSLKKWMTIPELEIDFLVTESPGLAGLGLIALGTVDLLLKEKFTSLNMTAIVSGLSLQVFQMAVMNRRDQKSTKDDFICFGLKAASVLSGFNQIHNIKTGLGCAFEYGLKSSECTDKIVHYVTSKSNSYISKNELVVLSVLGLFATTFLLHHMHTHLQPRR
ncbi:MAG: hypothetical protein V4489_10220 [Chlamydiota bacterium]